jgi:hypothetical protein
MKGGEGKVTQARIEKSFKGKDHYKEGVVTKVHSEVIGLIQYVRV